MKKCPPGVMCIDNFFMFFIIFFFGIILYIAFKSQNIIVNNKLVQSDKEINPTPSFQQYFNPFQYFDPLLNPYSPPLRDERYINYGLNNGFYNGFNNGFNNINVATNIGAVDTNYRQMGIITPLNGSSKDNIMPLMGRPLFTNRDKWQYYTTSNQHNNVKLPVSLAGKSCTNEYGCDKIYNGDTIYIEGVNETYKVTIYDNNTVKYLPFI
jgi:hypothetical protein